METAEGLRQFGQRLKKFRLAAGLSQAKLAGLAGTTNRYISDLEHGRTPPSVKMLMRLADALGISMDALVGRTNEEPTSTTQPLRQRLTEEWRRLVREEVREELRRLRRGDAS